jgi:hypothetical protein
MPKDKGKRKSKSKLSKGPDKSSKDKASKGNPKKKRRTTDNAARGSKAVDPRHNAKVNTGLITSFVYDAVIPELEVSCKREIHIKGSHFKLRGAQAKAVFTFQVRRFSAAHEFKEKGVDDLIPAIKLKEGHHRLPLEGDDCDIWQGRTAVIPHLDAGVFDVHDNSAFDVGSQPWSEDACSPTEGCLRQQGG